MSGTFQGRLAFTSCTVNGGAVTFKSQSGDFDETPTAPIYTGVGIFTLTLTSPIDPNEACYQVTCRSIAARPRTAIVDSALTTADTIVVRVFDDANVGAPAADPTGFDLSISVKPSN
jgi:hypothetical protein